MDCSEVTIYLCDKSRAFNVMFVFAIQNGHSFSPYDIDTVADCIKSLTQ